MDLLPVVSLLWFVGGVLLAAYAFARLKASQAELATARNELAAFQERAPLAAFALDAEGRFARVGDRLVEWLGVSRRELVGRQGFADFLSAESHELFAQCLPMFAAQGYLEGLEFDMVGRHGQTRRVRLSATRGDFLLLDVTEQFRAQRRLTALAAEQRAILENDLVGAIRMREGRVVWKNRTAEVMFGYAPGELRGRLPQALFVDEHEYAEVFAGAVETLGQGGRFRTQVRMRHKDGTLRWVEISAVRPSPTEPEMVWSLLDVSALHKDLHVDKPFSARIQGIP